VNGGESVENTTANGLEGQNDGHAKLRPQ